MAFIDTAFDGEIVSPEQWVVLAYVVDIQLKPNGSTMQLQNFAEATPSLPVFLANSSGLTSSLPMQLQNFAEAIPSLSKK